MLRLYSDPSSFILHCEDCVFPITAVMISSTYEPLQSKGIFQISFVCCCCLLMTFYVDLIVSVSEHRKGTLRPEDTR